MESGNAKNKILAALLREPTNDELQATIKRYEGLLTFIADAPPAIRNKALRPWKTKPSGKPGRPRTRDNDESLVEVIEHLSNGGEKADAEAIREFLEAVNEFRRLDGLPDIAGKKKEQKAKTLANRLIEARKRIGISRK